MWTKLDDKFPDHPKVQAAGPLAGWLYVCGLCYANRYLTDGKIAKGMAKRLADVEQPDVLAAILVTVGLWEDAGDHYIIHDFHDCNPTAEEARAKRELVSKERSRAGKRGAEARWQNGKTDNKNMAPNPNPIPITTKSNDLVVDAPKSKQVRQTSYPDDFTITPDMAAWAGEQYPELDIEAATEEWSDAMRANRTKYRYTDWQLAWKNGMKRAAQWAAERGGKRNGSNGKPTLIEVLADIHRGAGPIAVDEGIDQRRLPAGGAQPAYRRGA